jgi:hypothetical protein
LGCKAGNKLDQLAACVDPTAIMRSLPQALASPMPLPLPPSLLLHVSKTIAPTLNRSSLLSPPFFYPLALPLACLLARRLSLTLTLTQSQPQSLSVKFRLQDDSSDPDEVMSPAPAKVKAKPRATGAAAAAAKGPSRLGGGSSAAAGRGGSKAPAVSPGPKAAFGRTISSPSPVVERKKAAAVKRKPKSERVAGGVRVGMDRATCHLHSACSIAQFAVAERPCGDVTSNPGCSGCTDKRERDKGQ